ncbi:hypothetical protein B5X24_HaOG202103 [Helicoverpa armigera]|uniref:Uncharacterized protein n=1 Tax=Helicoverpa armigera TaxID=29058 RepID=A0A2W1BZ65_HELAM|nr:hypothetical protein B5X24_HaOG202103 [Helicoverpa armigera]
MLVFGERGMLLFSALAQQAKACCSYGIVRASYRGAALDKMILDETRILPLFETRYHHYREKRSVSLVQNEFLECRWSEFMKTCHQKTMFRFPTVEFVSKFTNL